MKIDLALLLLVATLAAASAADAPENAALPRVGDPAPELGFEHLLQAPAEAAVGWQELAGQVVVLEFWSTWCAPCIEALPHLNAVAAALADRPVRHIAITTEPESVVAPFLEDHRIDAWIGLDTDKSVVDAYGVLGVPQTFLIDAAGRIAAVTGPREVTVAALERMLAGEPPRVAEQDWRTVPEP